MSITSPQGFIHSTESQPKYGWTTFVGLRYGVVEITLLGSGIRNFRTCFKNGSSFLYGGKKKCAHFLQHIMKFNIEVKFYKSFELDC